MVIALRSSKSGGISTVLIISIWFWQEGGQWSNRKDLKAASGKIKMNKTTVRSQRKDVLCFIDFYKKTRR